MNFMSAAIQIGGPPAREPEETLAELVTEIRRAAHEREAALMSYFRACQSPIEQIFILEYIRWYHPKPTYFEDRFGFVYMRTIEAMEANHYNSRAIGQNSVAIMPQVRVTVGGNTYRVDFLIVVFPASAQDGEGNSIVIELDGHDYHERTKEQAASDRSRDRALIAAGYKVVRFTGSEVYRDPVKVLSEVENFIWAACV